jgi:hypothetical protein
MSLADHLKCAVLLAAATGKGRRRRMGWEEEEEEEEEELRGGDSGCARHQHRKDRRKNAPTTCEIAFFTKLVFCWDRGCIEGPGVWKWNFVNFQQIL